MRVAGNQFTKKRETAPIRAVRKKPAVISDNSTKRKAPDNFITPIHERIHDFRHCKTGEKIGISDSQLLALARQYVQWCESHEGLPLKSTFWRGHGIGRELLAIWCKTVPGLKELVDAGGEYIGDVREKKLEGYLGHISKMQAVYVPEYKEHEKEMIEYRERIRRLIEQADQLSKQEFIEALEKHFAPIPQGNVWIDPSGHDKTKDSNGPENREQTNQSRDEQEPGSSF